MKAIIGELEGASHDLDRLIGEMHHDQICVRTLEQVEERVKTIVNRMLVAVRGPEAALPIDDQAETR